jgi:hypothetical protein
MRRTLQVAQSRYDSAVQKKSRPQVYTAIAHFPIMLDMGLSFRKVGSYLFMSQTILCKQHITLTHFINLPMIKRSRSMLHWIQQLTATE